jgi:hypothetical protein
VYDADLASPSVGGPLLRSSILVAAAGNHDTDGRDLNKYPGGLAYFYYWEQPLNGPIGKEGGPFAPALVASEANRRAFTEASGEAFPRMAIFSVDKSLDGRADTTPDGVIYVITGAGGQHLYNPEQQDDRDSWLGFTHKFISIVHSLTVADVNGSTPTVRQLSGDGEELDRFVLTK